jgi:hypothetical protein
MTQSTEQRSRAEPALARDVAARFELSNDARALLLADHKPAEFFALLGRRELYRDAFRFAAHYLPKRRAIWWGCLCAWELYRDAPPPAEEAPLRAVVDWIREPSEPHRRAAFAAGRQRKAGKIGSALAMAVFSAEGSLAPDDAPQVEPPDAQAAGFVAAAVILAGQMVPRKQRGKYQHHFLELAVDLSRGNALCEGAQLAAQALVAQPAVPHGIGAS